MTPASRRLAEVEQPGFGAAESWQAIQSQYGISADEFQGVVASAVRDAWAMFEEVPGDLDVAIDSGTGRLLVEVSQRVVEGVPANSSELPVAQALELDREARAGALVRRLVELSPTISARAALLARSRLGAWLRERRQQRLEGEAEERRGQLVDALVERQAKGNWLLRAGSLQAYLPPEEQIPKERLQRGQHLAVVLLESRRPGGPEYLEVRCSRTSPLLLRRLLESEVPEVGEGSLLLRGLVREPGERAKVAVESRRSGVDAKGACIGPKGVRIRAVVAQLAGEKIDVLEWSADPAEYVARALAPAPVAHVTIEPQARRALVTVAAESLSLAIGKEGQNARLAARLTGWRIDIHAPGGMPG